MEKQTHNAMENTEKDQNTENITENTTQNIYVMNIEQHKPIIKIWGDRRCYGRVTICCSTYGNRGFVHVHASTTLDLLNMLTILFFTARKTLIL